MLLLQSYVMFILFHYAVYFSKNLHLSQGMFDVCVLCQPPLSWNGIPLFPWGAEMTPCTFYGTR